MFAGTGGPGWPPTPCPAGHYWPRGTKQPTQFQCPPGTWSNRTGLTADEECAPCPTGWFCVSGAPVPSGTCRAGHYCPEGEWGRVCPGRVVDECWERKPWASLHASQVKVGFPEDLPERRAGTGQPMSILTGDSWGVSAQTKAGLGEWHPLIPAHSQGPPSRTHPQGGGEKQLCLDNAGLTPLFPPQVQSGAPSSPAQRAPTALSQATGRWKTVCPAHQGPSAPVGPPSLCSARGKGGRGVRLFLKLSDHVLHARGQHCSGHRGICEER